MSEQTGYSLRSWKRYFEVANSRRVRTVNWLPLTNKLDGKGFRRLSRLPNAVEEFAAWILIPKVASPMPVRGVLRDDDGPLTAEDLADKAGFPAVILESAFEAITCDNIG